MKRKREDDSQLQFQRWGQHKIPTLTQYEDDVANIIDNLSFVLDEHGFKEKRIAKAIEAGYCIVCYRGKCMCQKPKESLLLNVLKIHLPTVVSQIVHAYTVVEKAYIISFPVTETDNRRFVCWGETRIGAPHFSCVSKYPIIERSTVEVFKAMGYTDAQLDTASVSFFDEPMFVVHDMARCHVLSISEKKVQCTVDLPFPGEWLCAMDYRHNGTYGLAALDCKNSELYIIIYIKDRHETRFSIPKERNTLADVPKDLLLDGALCMTGSHVVFVRRDHKHDNTFRMHIIPFSAADNVKICREETVESHLMMIAKELCIVCVQCEIVENMEALHSIMENEGICIQCFASHVECFEFEKCR